METFIIYLFILAEKASIAYSFRKEAKNVVKSGLVGTRFNNIRSFNYMPGQSNEKDFFPYVSCYSRNVGNSLKIDL